MSRTMLAIFIFIACNPAFAQHKGSVKPNWWLADFNKKDEAYYLSLDQIRVGSTEEEVISEFGKKFKKSDFTDDNGVKHTLFKYDSYRARQFSDPIDSFVTVDFVDGHVVNARQIPAPGSDVVESQLVKEEKAQSSPEDRLKKLQELLDKKLITPSEFDQKRAEILKQL